MKRFLAVLLMAMLLTTMLPATSFAASQKTAVYSVKAPHGLWLHSKANDKKSTRIRALSNGTAFVVTKTSGKWYRIKTLKRGYVGWVFKTHTARGAAARVTTQKSGLNIRKGAGEKYGLLGSAPRNAKVTVSYIQGNWYNVTYRKLTGWSLYSTV